ncbi:hypothetical protein BS78_06G032700 [Paspalum vaginatum]|nr:hypothetical protein BS78_06G032700 [Paspalum vaginatum]
MKIALCAILMLVIISNCTAEMRPAMAAEKEHAELTVQATTHRTCNLDPCNPGRRDDNYP